MQQRQDFKRCHETGASHISEKQILYYNINCNKMVVTLIVS